MRTIKIVDLEIFAYHGVYPEERENGQKFLVCAELKIAGRESCFVADTLQSTVDYAQICRDITEFMTQSAFNLIETAADGLARLLLSRYAPLQSAQIEVKKPSAPIEMALGYVSAVSLRSRHNVFIGLGSNLGDREQHLNTALELIAARPDCRIEKISAFKNTAPYGKHDQANFLNAVAELSTVLEPFELLAVLQEAEHKAGRVRTEKWGPRTLDLDILFYDDLILSEPALTVPHYDLHNRPFVLDALCELRPNLIHPVLRLPVSGLLSVAVLKKLRSGGLGGQS